VLASAGGGLAVIQLLRQAPPLPPMSPWCNGVARREGGANTPRIIWIQKGSLPELEQERTSTPS